MFEELQENAGKGININDLISWAWVWGVKYTENRRKRMRTNLYKETSNKFSQVISDLNNYGEPLTDKRILEELEWLLYISESDGWENHLKNSQKLRSLKCLIKKNKEIQEKKDGKI